jgi:septal ring factor EnvC (AmiA/AmiB activator)
MRRPLLLVPVVLLFLAFTFATTLRARQNRADPDVLAALLIEVKGLRAAMDSMAAAGPRVQLAMGRLQLQEQRITALARRLDEVRDRRAGVEREVTSHKQRIAALEESLRETPLPGQGPPRVEVEQALKQVRAEHAAAAANMQRLQNDDAALSQDLAAEQGRWSEINQRLEELDRALGRR